MTKKWNRFNGMAPTSSYNNRQRSFWHPPILNVKNSTEEEVSEEKSNDEPEQLEIDL